MQICKIFNKILWLL